MQTTKTLISIEALCTRWYEDHLWIPSRKLSFSFRINRGNSHWFSSLHFQRSTLSSSFLFKMISALKQFTNWLSSCFFLSVIAAMFTSWSWQNAHSKRLKDWNESGKRYFGGKLVCNQHGGIHTEESCEETISLFTIIIYHRGENAVISVDSRAWWNILWVACKLCEL